MYNLIDEMKDHLSSLRTMRANLPAMSENTAASDILDAEIQRAEQMYDVIVAFFSDSAEPL